VDRDSLEDAVQFQHLVVVDGGLGVEITSVPLNMLLLFAEAAPDFTRVTLCRHLAVSVRMRASRRACPPTGRQSIIVPGSLAREAADSLAWWVSESQPSAWPSGSSTSTPVGSAALPWTPTVGESPR